MVNEINTILDQVLDAAEEALIKHAIYVRDAIWQNAPLAFGTLRSSFKVTDLTRSTTLMQVKIESSNQYAEKIDSEEHWHMPFIENSRSGQESFTKLGKRGGGEVARYWSGFAIARSTGVAQRYATNYIQKSIEQTGGDDGLQILVQKAIDEKIGD